MDLYFNDGDGANLPGQADFNEDLDLTGFPPELMTAAMSELATHGTQPQLLFDPARPRAYDFDT